VLMNPAIGRPCNAEIRYAKLDPAGGISSQSASGEERTAIGSTADPLVDVIRTA